MMKSKESFEAEKMLVKEIGKMKFSFAKLCKMAALDALLAYSRK